MLLGGDPAEDDGEVLAATCSAVSGPPGWYQRTDTQVVSRMKR